MILDWSVAAPWAAKRSLKGTRRGEKMDLGSFLQRSQAVG